MRFVISKITNSALFDIQCPQASMAIIHGDLGGRVSSFAIPAFLASAASTLPLQEDILSLCTSPTDSFLEQYLWFLSSGLPPDFFCQKNSPSGTDPVFRLTVHSSNPHLLSRRTERGSWLCRRRTEVIGFLHCPSLKPPTHEPSRRPVPP